MFTHVDKLLTIRNLTLRNRIFRSAHATGLAFHGVFDDFIAYHEARARGGVALSFLEIMSVHPSSPGFLPSFKLPAVEDGYRRLVDAAGGQGMALFQQLWHGGHNSINYEGLPTWSASDVPSPSWGGAPPIPMTKGMIDDVIGGFADAARTIESWGIQGAEVHAGHNYLVQQFLQPATNRREDEYGGSLENRARFLIEVLQAVRSAVSPDFVLGVRMGESETGTSDAEELAQVVRMIDDRGLIDFLDATHAGYYALGKCIAGPHDAFGYQLEHNAPLRKAASVPVFVIGRFRTMEEADQTIRSGEADMVGMTRATIADPDLVNKSLAGKIDQVRPCIACAQDCIGGLMTKQRIGCVVNPAVGEERTLSETLLPAISSRKRVVIVGGGPSGMEAARIAAARGHEAILFEAEPDLGGAVKMAARSPTREGIGDISVWLQDEIFRSGVDVRLSSYVDASEIAALEPDHVIVATGSWPRLDGVLATFPAAPIKGMDDPRVTSSYEVMAGPPPAPGRRVVVIDDVGHFEAVGVAEFLLAHGAEVTFVTRHISFAPYIEMTYQNDHHLRRLARYGRFDLRLRTRALEVGGPGVSVIPTYQEAGGNEGDMLPADMVVVITANAPSRQLYDELREKGISAELAGDALSPRYLGMAIREGRKAAWAI
ncbi:2,4-dienoyl-CoA reductase [Sphingobium faniae]|nr:2,4-dienoyl-CoA reductase [Sphingobium faniae]